MAQVVSSQSDVISMTTSHVPTPTEFSPKLPGFGEGQNARIIASDNPQVKILVRDSRQSTTCWNANLMMFSFLCIPNVVRHISIFQNKIYDVTDLEDMNRLSVTGRTSEMQKLTPSINSFRSLYNVSICVSVLPKIISFTCRLRKKLRFSMPGRPLSEIKIMNDEALPRRDGIETDDQEDFPSETDDLMANHAVNLCVDDTIDLI